MKRSIIKSTGRYLPDRHVTNEELAGLMDTSNEWIVQRTGIEARYWVREGEDVGTSDLAYEASIIALQRADWNPEDLDLIVFATMTPDVNVPGSGAFLQNRLGEKHVPAPGFTPDSWLRHRDFKNIFQAEPNNSDLAQRSRVSMSD